MGDFYDYQVVLIHFPTSRVKEAVSRNEDGSFTIFIEETLSREQKETEFLHAMRHITNDDFYKTDIQKIEREARKLAI